MDRKQKIQKGCGGSDSLLPVHKQRLKVLGILIGQPAQNLFERIPWVNDPQTQCDQNKRRSSLPAALDPRDADSSSSRPHVLPSRSQLRVWACQCCPGQGCRTLVQLCRFLHMTSFIVASLADSPVPCFEAVRECRRWEEPEPNQPQFGWQQKATRKLEKKFIDDVGVARTGQCQPSPAKVPARATCISLHKSPDVESFGWTLTQPFRLLLLHLPLPLSMRTCRCGRQLDV